MFTLKTVTVKKCFFALRLCVYWTAVCLAAVVSIVIHEHATFVLRKFGHGKIAADDEGSELIHRYDGIITCLKFMPYATETQRLKTDTRS